jgi:glycosyltransferase involved in cell wall biosynthesis
MTRFVFVTQQVDPDHPALGATVAKIRALAQRVDEVAVLCERAVPGALPENCRVRTFGARTQAGRGARFESALARELVDRPVAVLAHMAPVFAVLAAPLTVPRRVPLLLWFTHWRGSRLLRVAERLATRVVSVDARSFPLASGKVVATGHGIDLAELPCASHEPGLRLLALGRYSPAKGLETIVRAVAQVPEARLVVHGPALTVEEEEHRGALERLVGELGLAERVRLEDAVPRSEVPRLLAEHDALVNNMRAGAPDKVVYEAAATCMPVLASNPVFDALLPPELRFERDDPASLAERLRALGDVTEDMRRELRLRVERDHSVDTWAERVLAAAQR